jgi:hypothetical protein
MLACRELIAAVGSHSTTPFRGRTPVFLLTSVIAQTKVGLSGVDLPRPPVGIPVHQRPRTRQGKAETDSFVILRILSIIKNISVFPWVTEI